MFVLPKSCLLIFPPRTAMSRHNWRVDPCLCTGKCQGFLKATFEVRQETNGKNHHVHDEEPQTNTIWKTAPQSTWTSSYLRFKKEFLNFLVMQLSKRIAYNAAKGGWPMKTKTEPWGDMESLDKCHICIDSARHTRVVSCCSPSPHLRKHRVMLCPQDRVSSKGLSIRDRIRQGKCATSSKLPTQ